MGPEDLFKALMAKALANEGTNDKKYRLADTVHYRCVKPGQVSVVSPVDGTNEIRMSPTFKENSAGVVYQSRHGSVLALFDPKDLVEGMEDLADNPMFRADQDGENLYRKVTGKVNVTPVMYQVSAPNLVEEQESKEQG